MSMSNTERFNHPIFQPLWLSFSTPAVRRLDAKLKQWIRCGITGAIIRGAPRTGKTTAIEKLRDSYTTPNNSEKIPGHLNIVVKRDSPTIRNCYSTLITSTRQKINISSKSEKMFEQMLDFFCDLAFQNSQSMVLLFVDEFHRLSMNQINVFADLQNYLRDRGVTLLVYFIGNEQESSPLLQFSKTEDYSHLGGRFFTQIYNFNGVSNEQELEEVLRNYDETRYPENGKTYTEFFLPKAFSAGWRLESISPILWKTYQQNVSHEVKTNWGMQYLIGTVNPLLTDYLTTFGVDKINSKMIEQCLAVSGLDFKKEK